MLTSKELWNHTMLNLNLLLQNKWNALFQVHRYKSLSSLPSTYWNEWVSLNTLIEREHARMTWHDFLAHFFSLRTQSHGHDNNTQNVIHTLFLWGIGLRRALNNWIQHSIPWVGYRNWLVQVIHRPVCKWKQVPENWMWVFPRGTTNSSQVGVDNDLSCVLPEPPSHLKHVGNAPMVA